MQDLPAIEDDLRPKFSRWIREQNRSGSQPTIRVQDVPAITNIPPLSFTQKAERVLEVLVEQTGHFGQEFHLGSVLELQAFTETFIASDLVFIGRYLEERGFLYDSTKMSAFRLTGNGFERVEKNQQVNKSSSQAFVAMWFDPELDPVWKDGFGVGIRRAGYEPMRIDGKQHNHKICDEIVAEIRRSRFLVGDFTGHRGGVYYEAGFAGGLGIPVIFTCRKDYLKDLHFDVAPVQHHRLDGRSRPRQAAGGTHLSDHRRRTEASGCIAQGSMAIFISYNHNDRHFVENLAENLVAAKHHIWIDRWELSLGDSLTQKIQGALTKAHAILVILSKNSIESEWCKRELSAGLVRELEEKQTLVMPCVIDDCEIPLFLKDKLYADFRRDPDEAFDLVDRSLARFSNLFSDRAEQLKFLTDWAVSAGRRSMAISAWLWSGHSSTMATNGLTSC
jgi:hypothetical protein